ncbi:uncharacterized protein LOC131849674 [Achroia grisella]|uniref:uncharacterized protein LOC131849674 n=1 Tax=Achroia grisella TaxID=688607 RepID=UPI0027D2889A|nr:uncharacterized protein LOC131849674 [Achroia grisella]
MKYKLNNADWDTFNNVIASKISSLPIITQGTETICSNAFTEVLIQAANEVFPKKSSSKNTIPSPPWWDSECTEAIRKRKNAEKQYNLHSTLENFDIFCNISRTTRKLLRDKKLTELKGVLTKVKDSAPGEDGIPYSFLSHLDSTSLSYFLDIINSIMISGHIPALWKTQNIIPILKPDKTPSDIASYRPLALSSVLLKLSEHLIKNIWNGILKVTTIYQIVNMALEEGNVLLIV